MSPVSPAWQVDSLPAEPSKEGRSAGVVDGYRVVVGDDEKFGV